MYAHQELITLYTKALGFFRQHTVVRSIHRDLDICFNTIQREIAYGIQNCFKDCGINDSYITERSPALAVIIPIRVIPVLPPFSRLLFHYKKAYHDRLDLLEIHLDKRELKYEYANVERKALNKNFTIVSYLPLPDDILIHISEYIHIHYQKYQNVRDKYQLLRDQLVTII